MTIPAIVNFLKPENLIALFAAIMALGAALISWRSLVLSKKAYTISKRDHDEKFFEINPYLIEAVKWISQTGQPYVSFAVSFANRASLQSSLTKIELEITWRGANGVVTSAYVQPDPAVHPMGRQEKIETLSTPLNILGKETKSGWLSYKLPKFVLEQGCIDMYRLVGTTINGSRVSVETYLITTLSYEDH